MHWGRDGWLAVEDTPTSDSGLGFHVAALDTAALAPGSWIDFTWRGQDSGEWCGRDCRVEVRAPAAIAGTGAPRRAEFVAEGGDQ